MADTQGGQLTIRALVGHSVSTDAISVAQEANTKATRALEIANAASTNADNATDTANSATQIANAATTAANTAVSTATSAVETASAASTLAEQAAAGASTAVSQAESAVATANHARETANTADTNATNALNTANGIDGKATSALSNAEDAVRVAGEAKETADDISSTANTALSNSETALETANAARTTANGISSTAREALNIARDAAADASYAAGLAEIADEALDRAKLVTKSEVVSVELEDGDKTEVRVLPGSKLKLIVDPSVVVGSSSAYVSFLQRSRNYLVPTSFSNRTLNGVTFTNVGDGSFVIDGTASADTTFSGWVGTRTLYGYIAISTNLISGESTEHIYIGLDDTVRADISSNGNYITENMHVWEVNILSPGVGVKITIPNGAVIDNLTFRPMVETGGSIHEWSPYVATVNNGFTVYADDSDSFTKEVDAIENTDPIIVEVGAKSTLQYNSYIKEILERVDSVGDKAYDKTESDARYVQLGDDVNAASDDQGLHWLSVDNGQSKVALAVNAEYAGVYDATNNKWLLNRNDAGTFVNGCLVPNSGTLALVGDNNHAHDYLPLIGGTLTGNLLINKSSYDDANSGWVLGTSGTAYVRRTDGNPFIAFYKGASNKRQFLQGTDVTADAYISLPTTTGTLALVGDNNHTHSQYLTEHQSLAGYVPTSRTVNSKALSSNITLSASDVGALPTSGGTSLSLGSDSNAGSVLIQQQAVSNGTTIPFAISGMQHHGSATPRGAARCDVRWQNTSGQRVGQLHCQVYDAGQTNPYHVLAMNAIGPGASSEGTWCGINLYSYKDGTTKCVLPGNTLIGSSSVVVAGQSGSSKGTYTDKTSSTVTLGRVTVRKWGNLVTVSFYADVSAAINSFTGIITLPTGYRPQENIDFPLAGANNSSTTARFGRGLCYNGGDIQILCPVTGTYSANFSFIVA